jgi:hypothetical protein
MAKFHPITNPTPKAPLRHWDWPRAMVVLDLMVHWLWSAVSMTESSLNLGFIKDDIENQLKRSREILAEAQRLQNLLPQIQDGPVKQQVQSIS